MSIDLGAVDWGVPPAPALVALAALLLCWLLPGALRLAGSAAHPVAVASRAMGWSALKLNRARRSAADRAVRGFLIAVIFVGLAAWAGWAVELRVETVRYIWVAELVLVVLLLDPRGAAARARSAAGLLDRDRPVAAAALAGAEGAPMLAESEPHAAARLAAERAAQDCSSMLVAPLFWYLLFGLPGLLAARAAHEAAHRMAGSAPSRHAFGVTAAGLDAALGLIPAWIAALTMCLAALFVPGARPRAAIAGLAAGGATAAPAAALAGALGLSLGGPRRLRLAEERWREDRPWIGTGRARVAPDDLRRAAWFPALLSLIALAALAALLRAAQ